MTDALVVFFPFIYAATLVVISWLVSRFILRRGEPLHRALSCTAISAVIVWAVLLSYLAWSTSGVPTFPSVGLNYWIITAAITLAVFLWNLRSFKRRWVDYDRIFD